jgi:hypothetical protein
VCPAAGPAVKMPPPRAVCAGRGHDLAGYFFLPWFLPGILVSWVFAGQGRWDRTPGGRRWSSLATVERPRTAQGRPRAGALGAAVVAVSAAVAASPAYKVAATPGERLVDHAGDLLRREASIASGGPRCRTVLGSHRWSPQEAQRLCERFRQILITRPTTKSHHIIANIEQK